MNRKTPPAAFPIAAALLATPAAAQVTWTVDDSGGADFVQIQDAIDAAADGDVILVEPGNYASFAIVDKELVVTRASGDPVRVSSHAEVRDLAAGKLVELIGLRLGQPFTTGGSPALLVSNCAGSVRLSFCDMTGWDPVANGCPQRGYTYSCNYYYGCTDPFATRGADVHGSSDVVFNVCTGTGGRGSSHSEYHCSVATDGADGLLVDASVATVLGGTWRGRWGGEYSPIGAHCADGADAGHGLRVTNGSNVLTNLGNFTGETGGSADCDGTGCCGTAGGDGASAFVDASSTLLHRGGTFAPAPIGQGVFAAVRWTPYCVGTWTDCPCGNAGHGFGGCDNAHGTGGARLVASGDPSVAADTLRFDVTGLAPSGSPAAIFLQGPQITPTAVLGDGLICVGAPVLRLKGVLAANGAVSLGFGNPGDPPISVLGGVPAGGATRYYQVWYRSQPAFCTPSPANLSNGLQVFWDQ